MLSSESTNLTPKARPDREALKNRDDTLILGFELFDEKGKPRPRKILFSAQASPEKANSLFTKVFGRLMKWSAGRWAENHIRNLINTSTNAPPETIASMRRLLEDVKREGSIKRAALFQISAAAIVLEDTNSQPSRKQNVSIQSKFSMPETHIINRIAMVENTLSEMLETAPDDAKPQEIFKGVPVEKIINWITQHISKEKHVGLLQRIESLKKNDIPAHEIIAETWKKNSKSPIASKLFKFHKEACESGFIDYCRGAPLSALENKLYQLENFVSNHEAAFLAIQDKYSHHQYAKMIEAKNRLTDLLPLAEIHKNEKKYLENIEQYFNNKKFSDKDLHEKEDPEYVVSSPGPKKIHSMKQSMSTLKDLPAHEFLENALNHAPERLRNYPIYEFPRKAVDSGFIDYCKGKSLDELKDKIDALENFITDNDEYFASLEKILTRERFDDFTEKRNDLYHKIQDYRTSLSRVKSKTKLGKSADKVSPPSDGKSNDDVIRS